MDDTIYCGTTLFPTTKPFLEFLTSKNISYAFLSNNSSYSTSQYVERLANMGLEVTPSHFYTSTDYTIDFLKHFHPEYKKIFLLGMPGIRPAFESAGFQLVDDNPDAVVVEETKENDEIILKLKVSNDDMGKVIGKQGRIAKAIRTVVKSAANRENIKVSLEII
jgi:ribonucleotide monophosphatase NagD (HAD superfamily)